MNYRYAVALVVGLLIGAFLFPREVVKIVPEIKVEEKIKTVTVAEYIPKEVDKSTGKLEKTDVEANIGKPTVNVKVNGKPYEFSLLQEEDQKFEKGKVVLTQSGTIDINVKPQIIEKTGGIDVFVGKYSGVTIQHKRVGVDIGTNGKETDYRFRYKVVQW